MAARWHLTAGIWALLLALILGAPLITVQVAVADDRQIVRNAGSAYRITVVDEGDRGTATKSGAKANPASTKTQRRCWHAPVRDLDSIEYRLGEVPKSRTGYYTAEVCSDGTSRLVYMPRGGYAMPVAADPPASGGAPVVTPEVLAQQAFANLDVPEPQVRTAPRRGTPTLVGLRTWFWLDNAQRAERSARAQAGGVWAEATAKAQRLEIQLGDGADPVVCEDLGRPYDSGRPANEQSTDCAVIFKNPGTRRVTVTVEWGGTWQGSGGAGGSLPTISRTTTFDVIVREARSELVAG